MEREEILETAERLQEIRDEILNLVDEALDLVLDVDATEGNRAVSYWAGHIREALGADGYWAVHSYQDTINSVLELAEEEEED